MSSTCGTKSRSSEDEIDVETMQGCMVWRLGEQRILCIDLELSDDTQRFELVSASMLPSPSSQARGRDRDRATS